MYRWEDSRVFHCSNSSTEDSLSMCWCNISAIIHDLHVIWIQVFTSLVEKLEQFTWKGPGFTFWSILQQTHFQWLPAMTLLHSPQCSLLSGFNSILVLVYSEHVWNSLSVAEVVSGIQLYNTVYTNVILLRITQSASLSFCKEKA